MSGRTSGLNVPLSQNLHLGFFLWPLQKCLCDQGFWCGFGFHKESELRYNQTESDEEAKNVEESWTAFKQMVYSTASETLSQMHAKLQVPRLV